MPGRPTCLDLFSGVGGLSRALQPWFATVGYVEIDPDCRAILRKQMAAGGLEAAPVYEDVRELAASVPDALAGGVDCVAGGFPCQDISSRGHRAGFDGARSSLFYAMMAVVERLEPRQVFLENVQNICSMPQVWRPLLRELRRLGFTAVRWGVLCAADVGAPHLRSRWFCLARRPEAPDLPMGEPPELRLHPPPAEWPRPAKVRPWHPDIRRMVPAPATPAAHRAYNARVRQLGNAVCPAQGRLAYHCLASGGHDWAGRPHRGATLPQWGALQQAEVRAVRPPERARLRRSLPPAGDRGEIATVVPPAAYAPAVLERREARKKSGRSVSDLVRHRVRKPHLPTPRCSNLTAATLVTCRCLKDLATVLRYEAGTPPAQRRMVHPNPEFLEWMMGFPRGWTRA